MNIYVDGSYDIGKNKSSIGLTIVDKDSKENKNICKVLKKTKYTNSIFTEEFAILFAIMLVKKQYKDKKNIYIYSDNSFIVKTLKNKRKIKGKKFTFLNKAIDLSIELKNIKFIHVYRKSNPAHFSATYSKDYNIEDIHEKIINDIYKIIYNYKINLEVS